MSAKALNDARKYYQAVNVEYIQGTENNLLLIESNSIDIAVSFETIEHVLEPDILLSEIHRVLKGDGILLLSTPNGICTQKKYPQKPYNPFHCKEYSKDDLLILLNQFWDIAEYYGQHPMKIGSIEILQYQKWIRDYWFMQNLLNYSNFWGGKANLLLRKLGIVISSEPAYTDSCFPKLISNDEQAAYHFVICKPKSINVSL